jgi:Ca2+-binding EF-hand superfamily protein
MVRLLKTGKFKPEVLSSDQTAKVEKYEHYLETHKIPELFNRLLTQLIHDRPADIKNHLIMQLSEIHYNKGMQSNYFTSEDFENMFDAYDIAGEGHVDYNCLVQALQIAGVKHPEGVLEANFPHIKSDSLVNRPQFAQILTSEFKNHGYS